MSNRRLPKVHQREYVYNQAKLDLEEKMLEAVKRHDLTEGEFIRLVHEVSHNFISNCTKYMIRRERHGDEEKPGGFEQT